MSWRKNWPEQPDALYERLYSHVRMASFMQMGGQRKSIRPYFKMMWDGVKLPSRQSREDVEKWLMDVASLRNLVCEV